jgi:hypothetical protein
MQSNSECTLALPSCGTEASPGQNEILAKFAGILAAAVLADWLFYGHALGLSVAVFLAALACIAVLTNPVKARRRQVLLAVAVLVAALLPAFVELSFLSILFGVAGIAYAALMLTRPDVGWFDRMCEAGLLALSGIWRTVSDLHHMRTTLPAGIKAAAHAKSLAVWIVPLVLGGVFLMLFWSANPLIDEWLSAIDLPALLKNISFPRILFWLAAMVAVWPFVFIRLANVRARLEQEFAPTDQNSTPPSTREIAQQKSAFDTLLTPAAILRSLIVFNILFAVQTAMDGIYLWGGIALPDGMTYATYAHRGAYPLIFTALLAAAFVVAAMKPGSEAERSSPIRALVFLWTAQNVVLVISSILRLDLYVQIYSLTYLRVAAFAWMGLVGLGLILIVARIVLHRSNGWLIGANLTSLALTLYLCCFVNFPKVIAEYNVGHCYEVSGQGQLLDWNYLVSLGPQAVPSLDRYKKKKYALATYARNPMLEMRMRDLVNGHIARMRDWRAWTLRDWELGLYLFANADMER